MSSGSHMKKKAWLDGVLPQLARTNLLTTLANKELGPGVESAGIPHEPGPEPLLMVAAQN